jgi:hypothetical protein
MPINPMQRRARNSFLIGFLIALIIMAIVVAVLMKKIQTTNEALEALKALQTTVLVAADDIESGAEVSFTEDFVPAEVQTTVDPSMIISEDDFLWMDEDGNIEERIDPETGSILEKTMIMKVAVPAGTIVTKDMIVEASEETQDDERIMEYNMIVLPSQLENGDYVDIRLSLPTGENFIVVSKERVVSTTQTGLWLKLNQEQILTLENAIVENYQINGSKLFATQYKEPGIQNPAEITYPVSDNIRSLINADPNILDEAKYALALRYNNQQQVIQRNEHIAPQLTGGSSAVAAGVATEIASVQTQREEFVKDLQGSERIGAQD